MPTYLLKCENGHTFDRYLKLANYNDPQTCECGAQAKRQITKTMIAPMFEDYQSPIDGSPITSKKKRLNDLARSGCVPYEPSVREENNSRIKKQEQALEKAMDQTIEAQIEAMPSRKREKLEQELTSGADLTYHRG